MINVQFTRDDVVIGYGRYPSVDDLPDDVTLTGVLYRTVGSDASGRSASHYGPWRDGDGNDTYTVRVVDATT
jgi:hypothetical protein